MEPSTALRAVTVPPTDPRWVAFLERRSDATPFHHPAWTQMIAEAYRFPGGTMCVIDGSGQIQGGVPVMNVRLPLSPVRWVCLPFTDWCPLLIRDRANPTELAHVLDRYRRERAVGTMEIRGRLGGGVGHVVNRGFRHVLALDPDEEAVMARFHKSRVRAPIRRAEREGVVVRPITSADELFRSFWPLHLATRRRLGVPIQPRRFFETLFDRIIVPDLGFALTAYREDGKPLSSAVFLAWNHHIMYKFSASDREHSRLGAGAAVLWTAIRWGCRNGFRHFDFGRTERRHETLRAFKLGWGPTEHDLAYTLLAARAPAVGRGHLNKAVAGVLRRSPEWLTEVAGRLAYRYTA